MSGNISLQLFLFPHDGDFYLNGVICDKFNDPMHKSLSSNNSMILVQYPTWKQILKGWDSNKRSIFPFHHPSLGCIIIMWCPRQEILWASSALWKEYTFFHGPRSMRTHAPKQKTTPSGLRPFHLSTRTPCVAVGNMN